MKRKHREKTIFFCLLFSFIFGVNVSAAKIETPTQNTQEVRAMWISYLEFNEKQNSFTEAQFRSYIDEVFDQCVEFQMNTVIVQIRPFGDAFYPSSYYPWSVYLTGTQGKDPGYDPLEYMVLAAHERGLAFHAWLNPYRVTLNNTNVDTLASSNPARKWAKTKKRNVLSFNGNLYYNPAKKAVRNLVVNGVKEIVENYDVDGIHFDDYFYPALGSNYANNFDAPEYQTYLSNCQLAGKSPKSIINWRRSRVNMLVKEVYQAVKDINPDVQFGISPAGNIKNLYASSGYYTDVKKWMSTSGYIDYICPQIYWSFTNPICPYEETVDEWLSYHTNKEIKMYIGIAAYRAATTVETEWKEKNDVLMRQIQSSRKTEEVDGFFFFRHNSFLRKAAQQEISNLMSVLGN